MNGALAASTSWLTEYTLAPPAWLQSNACNRVL